MTAQTTTIRRIEDPHPPTSNGAEYDTTVDGTPYIVRTGTPPEGPRAGRHYVLVWTAQPEAFIGHEQDLPTEHAARAAGTTIAKEHARKMTTRS